MGGSSFSGSASWCSVVAAPRPLAWRQASPLRSNNSFQIGQLATLHSVPKDVNSVLYTQLPHVNDEVAKHPLVVIGSKDNGKIVTCLQVTSFGNRSLEQKYPGNSQTQWLRRSEYVAIDHGNTSPHSGVPVLRLANNETMRYQSYVHLDLFFTIETSHLAPWVAGNLQLDITSIRSLEHAFVDFVSGVVPRHLSHAIASPLDYRPRETLTMSWLGVNDHRFVKPARRSCAIAIASLPSPPPAQKAWATGQNCRPTV